ncbi:MAG: tRNA (N(6)-L-threonylcarbamoyladenosine(37)-C(2))-methylthiotransferase MtaB [Clostridiales bacterium]|jgi:threonylcarbamoyladenosine tRNA methylthiotransferase MtaB|nr:tRNA (N(6)-L-threonylcarbamoyladenosine(37)-C(2))-methylthiotransferase MtaB [Clostridiales bacterium]
MDTVAFHTLGCKVNQTETAALQYLFESAGYRTVPFSTPADVYVINTCTVTHLGDRKSRQVVRRARRINADSVIVVTGCYAQVAPEDVMAIPEVDLIVGTHSRGKLPELVLETKQKGRLNCVSPLEEKGGFESLPAAQTGSRTRAFLKVQEGCRQYCSYCIVPYARGPLYSRHPEDAVVEARRLAQSGFKELVLTGVHLGSYGVDLPGNIALSDLITRISPIDGIERIRISSVEPTEITPDLIETVMEHNKVCRHLHIPLQSGDDLILRRMNRKYDSGEFLYLVRWLQAQIPDIALTTDVMVGFPGETTEQFAHSLGLIQRAGFSRLHIFKYSPRQGTPAAKFPDQVPHPVKEERARQLTQLGDELASCYRERFVGKTVNVLFEEKAGRSKLAGLTEHYIRVTAKAAESLLGHLVQVKVTGNGEKELTGEIV